MAAAGLVYSEPEHKMTTGSPAVDYLEGALRAAVEYARSEFQISYAEAIGTLEVIKADLLAELNEEEDDDGHEPDEGD